MDELREIVHTFKDPTVSFIRIHKKEKDMVSIICFKKVLFT